MYNEKFNGEVIRAYWSLVIHSLSLLDQQTTGSNYDPACAVSVLRSFTFVATRLSSVCSRVQAK